MKVLLLAAMLAVSPPKPNNHQTARDFVGTFYNWYVGQDAVPENVPAWSKVLNSRPHMLSSRLRRGLAYDLKRKARASGHVDGIDFDPFFGSQDPCATFKMGEVRVVKKDYLVDIYETCRPDAKRPSVTLALRWIKNGFVVDDVKYPSGTSLRRLLKR